MPEDLRPIVYVERPSERVSGIRAVPVPTLEEYLALQQRVEELERAIAMRLGVSSDAR